MNSLDNFFKKRLSDYSPAEDEWNIPSEDLWEQASREFPKKKKRNFLWFWLPVGLLFLGLAGWFIGSNFSSNDAHQIVEKETTIVPQGKEVLDENQIAGKVPPVNDAQPSNNSNNSMTAEKLDQESIISQDMTPAVDNDKAVATQNIASQVDWETVRAEKIIQNSDSNVSDTKKPKLIELKNSTDLNINDQSKYAKDGPFAPRQNVESGKLKESKNIAEIGEESFPNPELDLPEKEVQKNPNFVVSDSLNDSESEENIMVNVKMEAPAMIYNAAILSPLVPLSFSTASLSGNLTQSPNMLSQLNGDQSIFTKKFKAPLKYLRGPAKEVGLSSRFMFFDILDGWYDGETPKDSVNIKVDFQNINFEYRQWIGRKWSVATGLYVIKAQINLQFSVFQQIGEAEIESFIDEGYIRVVDKNSPGSDFAADPIRFLDGAALYPGEVNLKGIAMVDIRLLRLPVLINRHWYKKHFEFILGTGLSLNYMSTQQLGNNISIYQEDMLLNEPFDDDEVDNDNLGIHVEMQAGIRYHLGKRLNLGLTTSIIANDVFFSGVGLGMYYRWRK